MMEADFGNPHGPVYRPDAPTSLRKPNQSQSTKTFENRDLTLMKSVKEISTNLLCAVCFGINGRVCQGCFNIAYCSREHQTQHWAFHQQFCRPMVCVQKDEVIRNLSLPPEERNLADRNIGMYKAARPLSPKNTVLHFQPIMHAPHNKGLPAPPDSTLCLGCNGWYQNSQGYRCTKCKWPVCSQWCEMESCHAKYECKVFTERKLYPPQNPSYYNGDIILTLRCLMLKHTKPVDWEQLIALEPLVEHLVRPKQLLDADEKVAKYLLYNCGVQDSLGVTYKEIMIISKAIDFCSIWLPERAAYLRDKQFTYVSAKYVFPMKIFVAEECAPNCSWSLYQSPELEKCSIRLRTAVPIYPGQCISASFSGLSDFGATFPRRYENSRFVLKCQCNRCLDPTEGGTFFSGVKCPACNDTQEQGKGYLLPENPLNFNCTWYCQNPLCNSAAAGTDIANDVNRIHKEIMDNSNSLQGLVNVIKNNEGIKLHRHHYLIMMATMLSIDLCWGVCRNTCLHHISVSLLDKAKALTVKLSNIYKVIYSGFFVQNAKSLYHFQMFHGIARVRELYWLFHHEKQPKEEKLFWPNEFWDILMVQKHALEVLMHEPPGSAERENAILMKGVLEDTESLLITERRDARIEEGTVLALHKVYSRFCSGYLYPVLPVFEDKELNELVLFKGSFCKDLADAFKLTI